MGMKIVIRKLTAVLLVLLLVLSIAACSNSSKDKATDEIAETSGSDGPGEAGDPAGTDDAADTAGSPAGTGDASDAAKAGLSKGYHTDAVPVYKGSTVVESGEDNSNPLFSMYYVVCWTDKPYEDVVQYYKDIMSRHQIIGKQSDSAYYYATASISDVEDVDVCVIDLSQESYSDEEVPEGAKTSMNIMYKKKSSELPEGYRSDLVPVMEGSKPKDGSIYDESDGRKSYSLTFTTTQDYQDVVEYYREIMLSADSLQETESHFTCTITGIMDNVEIDIYINKLPEGTAYTIVMVV